MKRRAVLASLAAFATTLALAAEPTSYTLPAPSGSALEGSTYEITKTEGPTSTRYEIRVLGEANDHRADVTITDMDRIQVVEVKRPGKPMVTVTSNKLAETVEVMVEGRKGVAKIDRVGNKWINDETMTRFKAAHGAAIGLAGAVLDDVVMMPKFKARKPKEKESSLCKPAVEGGVVTPAALTASFSTCGTLCGRNTWGTSKYLCCYEAKLLANECCWNQYCIGCYCWDNTYPNPPGCSTSCFYGNWWCFCTAVGYACTGTP